MGKINTVFLIDDDDIYRFLVQKEIQKAGMASHIIPFTNGLEAINQLKTELKNQGTLPEIILLDLNMPVMDGWEFLEEYKQLEPQLPQKIDIYIVSSSIAADDVGKAKTLNMVTDYMIKPVTRDKFTDMLERLN
jgi:CheY-like chemotaxis protein